jgi:hypothetical protein
MCSRDNVRFGSEADIHLGNTAKSQAIRHDHYVVLDCTFERGLRFKEDLVIGLQQNGGNRSQKGGSRLKGGATIWEPSFE